MKERTRRLVIAFVLTIADVAIFERYAGDIWQVFGYKISGKFYLIALLGLWVLSAGVIWSQILNDVHVTFRLLNRAFSQDMTPDLRRPKGDSNV